MLVHDARSWQVTTEKTSFQSGAISPQYIAEPSRDGVLLSEQRVYNRKGGRVYNLF